MSKLQVLIATYGQEGLLRIARMFHPVIDGVEYLVSCQGVTEDGRLLVSDESGADVHGAQINIPEKLRRPDFKLSFSPTKGLSRNRNMLLRLASAPYCLIADDDLDFFEDGLKEITELFDANPDLDVAAFRYILDSGGFEKEYPHLPFNLKKPAKGYFPTSFELAFRTSSVRVKGILFNENFGVGSPRYACGEEDLWLADLLEAGLRGNFYPVTIVRHHGATTGLRKMVDPAVLRAQGVVIARLYPLTSLLRIPLKAWRVAKATSIPVYQTLPPLLQGLTDSVFRKKELFRL